MNRVKNILILLTAALTTAGAPIKTGAKAPAVMLRDEANRPWTLAATLVQPATKAVLLYFYPKDDTPGCTKQACGWRDRYGSLLGKGVVVTGVSFDTTASHQRFAKKHNLPFTLLADTAGKAADAYGVRVPKRKLTRRVSFLISKTGTVLHVVDDRDPAKHFAEMQMAIAKHLP